MDADRDRTLRVRMLEEREHQFMEALDDMALDEIRWTVRLLADALTEERWQGLLAGYHELLPIEETRAFLREFVSHCTRLAILDLEAKRGADAESLQSLTDTDLQGMSAMEKWQMIAREPGVLDHHRTARELARLTLCLQPDLLHDAMVPRAAIEFPFYFRLQEALQRLPASEISRLADRASAGVPATELLPAAEAHERLAALRREITQAAGFTGSAEQWIGASMDRLPADFFPAATRGELPGDRLAEGLRQLEGLSTEQLRLNLQVLADQLSLRESQELIGPSRSQYPSIGEMPPEALRRLLITLTAHLADRGLCDFIQRYRTGKFLVTPPLTGEVWNLLPEAERLQLLERDNGAMDLAQMARHLAKILLGREYRMLDDAASQMALVASPLYQGLVERLVRLGDAPEGSGLVALNRTVTGLVLEMERSPREEREGKLEQIRMVIGEALGLSGRDIAAPSA